MHRDSGKTIRFDKETILTFTERLEAVLQDSDFYLQFHKFKSLLKTFHPSILNAQYQALGLKTTPAQAVFNQKNINWPLVEYLVVFKGVSFQHLKDISANKHYLEYKKHYAKDWQKDRELLVQPELSYSAKSLLRYKFAKHQNTAWLLEEYQSLFSKRCAFTPSNFVTRFYRPAAYEGLRQRRVAQHSDPVTKFTR